MPLGNNNEAKSKGPPVHGMLHFCIILLCVEKKLRSPEHSPGWSLEGIYISEYILIYREKRTRCENHT